jgi:signal transduction histidine kinase
VRECERLTTAIHGDHAQIARPVRSLRSRLNDAHEGLERLARLTAILFDTAAMRSGTFSLQRAPCNLAAVMRAQVEAQRVAFPRREIRLRMPAAGCLPVEIDTDRIGRALTNFLTNALKYSPSDQPVEVTVEIERTADQMGSGVGWVRVAVRDHGPGLPEAEQERVWEPFHRVPGVEPQPGASESLGLGLHICRTLIEAHGGRVGVVSAPGQGATFWFKLPLATGDVAQRSCANVPRTDPSVQQNQIRGLFAPR